MNALLLLALLAPAAEPAPMPRTGVDLTGYRPAAEAIRADAKQFSATRSGLPGYLGVQLNEVRGMPVIDDVDADAPADVAGLLRGDVLLSIGGEAVPTLTLAREKLRGRTSGEALKVVVRRGGKEFAVVAKLRTLSAPMKASTERPVAGIQLETAKAGGVEIAGVTAGGAASKAGLKAGDVIAKINGTAIDSDATFRDVIGQRAVGETVTFFVKRGKEDVEAKVTLAAATDAARGGASGWDDRLPTNFRKPKYRLAIVGVEYPDVKHSDKVAPKDWETALFSSGVYTEKSATGQKTYGSMNDYYRELSYGKLAVEGKFVGWVEAVKKKADYNLGSSVSASDKSKYFAEVMEKVTAKFGKESVADFDGVFFIYAGERVNTSRGGLYWPHRSSFRFGGKSWSYFIVPEMSRADRVTDISVICHEFGHMLGLPDLYARPEQPGSEGVGVWCAMSQQLPNGRPQHFSAWSKEQMGWLKPVVVDPRVRQKLILSPVEDSPTECLKIPARSDLSEYFLVENRQRKGWDKDLPADGLLIWRVLPGNRGMQQVYLEEAHGVEGPTGPRVFTGAVPFPSPANNSFTPYTTPSSKAQLGGGLDVYITNIRRLSDGRVALQVGYEFQ